MKEKEAARCGNSEPEAAQEKRKTPANNDRRSPGQSGYLYIKRLKRELSRSLPSLLALGDENDPWFADRDARLEHAEWFARLWDRFGFSRGIHLRAIHYRLISQRRKAKLSDGTPYENTYDCWQELARSSKDARYLGLVPIEAFTDRGSEECHEHLSCLAGEATLEIEVTPLLGRLEPPAVSGFLADPPNLIFTPATVDQRYHIELWTEKSTINAILDSLAERYGCNVVIGTGEISLTRCYELVQRAKASGRPVRILYVSDFDPGGQSMPLAAARKIEFLIRNDDPKPDIQVRNVVLTLDQCNEYNLPETPIKESERRAAAFVERFERAATELDALEALHPGVLRQILAEEIERYYDDTLGEAVDERSDEIESEIEAARDAVLERHADEIAAIESDHTSLSGGLNEALEAVTATFRDRYAVIADRYNQVQIAITREIRESAPDVEDDWPEPNLGDEDDDPLFDSARGYIEQIDRYKQHQGKPTAGRRRSA